MAAYGSLPFAEQIAFLRDKLDLPTARWTDLWQAGHDRAFVVAGAMKADLLADLHAAVLKGVAEGTTLETFRADFEAIVAKRGWTGWTGEGTQAGRAWRTRVIYSTNLRSSYAAGRWAQVQEVKAHRPYLQYRHNDSVLHPRPLHQSWDGLVLPADDPWWKTHWPPNGWGCQCRAFALNDRDLERLGKSGPDQAPNDGTYEWRGRQIPNGIDPGWAYAPGANRATPLRELVEQKLFNLDAPIGAAMWERLRPSIALETRLGLADLVDRVSETMIAKGESLLVSAVSPATLADLAGQGITLESAGIWLRDHELLHALREAKSGAARALSPEIWRDLPRLLETATPYLDTSDQALIYAFDVPDGTGKVVIRINYRDKIRQGDARGRVTANFIRTGGIVEPHNLDQVNYLKLK